MKPPALLSSAAAARAAGVTPAAIRKAIAAGKLTNLAPPDPARPERGMILIRAGELEAWMKARAIRAASKA